MSTKLNKFGYGVGTELSCCIKKIINTKFYAYENTKDEWIKNTKFSSSDNKNFTIATWNIWGSEHFKKMSMINKRIKFIIKTLIEEDIDIVCMQEVSKYVIDKLCANKTIQQRYCMSSIKQPWRSIKVDVHGSEYEDVEPNCWSFILSKYPVNKSSHIVLSSEMIDFSCIVATIQNMTIVNLHLQSGGMGSGMDAKLGHKYHKCRIDQMAHIKKYIADNYDKNNVIYLGDFNFDLNENKLFPESTIIRKGLKDAWKINNKDIGTTENTYVNTMRYNIKQVHKNYRYDGMLYKSDLYKPIASKIFANQKIFEISPSKFKKNTLKEAIVLNKNKKVDWFLSDHFGVITHFIVQ